MCDSIVLITLLWGCILRTAKVSNLFESLIAPSALKKMHPADCIHDSHLSALWLQLHASEGSEAVRCSSASCFVSFTRFCSDHAPSLFFLPFECRRRCPFLAAGASEEPEIPLSEEPKIPPGRTVVSLHVSATALVATLSWSDSSAMANTMPSGACLTPRPSRAELRVGAGRCFSAASCFSLLCRFLA